jgi:hypothetical protein
MITMEYCVLHWECCGVLVRVCVLWSTVYRAKYCVRVLCLTAVSFQTFNDLARQTGNISKVMLQLAVSHSNPLSNIRLSRYQQPQKQHETATGTPTTPCNSSTFRAATASLAAAARARATTATAAAATTACSHECGCHWSQSPCRVEHRFHFLLQR